jgi:hypothetical protein
MPSVECIRHEGLTAACGKDGCSCQASGYRLQVSGIRGVGAQAVRCEDGGRALPVFGSEQEAGPSLRFRVLAGAARWTTPDGLASRLLDPSLEVPIKSLVYPVTLEREEFVEVLADRAEASGSARSVNGT